MELEIFIPPTLIEVEEFEQPNEQIPQSAIQPELTPLADDEPILDKIFLDSSDDDLSKDPERRLHGQQQVVKFKNVIPGIEDKIFTEHTAEVYMYKPDDGYVDISKATNFYTRRYESLSEMKSERTYPFFYENNTVNLPSQELNLGGIELNESGPNLETQTQKRRQFYLNWDFSTEIKENIYFSQIPELHTNNHFPRFIKHEIDLEPNELLGLKFGQIFGSSGLLPEEGYNRIYDKMCLKYIKSLKTTVDPKRFVLAKGGSFRTMSSYLYPLESLFSKNEDSWQSELIESDNLMHIGKNSVSFHGESYTLDQSEKMALSRMFSGLDEDWDSANCIKKRVGKRTYKEILDGTTAPSEPLLYELVKKDEEGRKINSFFYPARLFHNLSLSDPFSASPLRFIDSQIAHNKNYNYTLKVHQIIYGSSYDFESNPSPTQSSADVDIYKSYSVNTDIDIRIMPIELFSWSTSLHSRPGKSPKVTLLPQKTKAGVPKFFIETSFGDNVIDSPANSYVPLSSHEHSDISRLIESYSSSDTGVKQMLFQTKFQNKAYEVYRIDTPPTSLVDFEGSLIKTVSPLYSSVAGYSPSGVCEDEVLPNKEYYYLFRAIDVWGTPSLPTGPYKFQVIKDADAFVVNFTSYNMKDQDPKYNTQMRRMVKISPSWKHLIVPDLYEVDNAQSAFDVIETETGSEELKNYLKKKMTEDSGFWGKKYKIRITSRKTGRKIDILFTPNLTSS